MVPAADATRRWTLQYTRTQDFEKDVIALSHERFRPLHPPLIRPQNHPHGPTGFCSTRGAAAAAASFARALASLLCRRRATATVAASSAH